MEGPDDVRRKKERKGGGERRFEIIREDFSLTRVLFYSNTFI